MHLYLLQIIRSLGCSKCLNNFPRENKTNRSDYSVYGVENWTLRIGTEHKLFAEESLTFNTAEKRSKFELLHGCTMVSFLHCLTLSQSPCMLLSKWKT